MTTGILEAPSVLDPEIEEFLEHLFSSIPPTCQVLLTSSLEEEGGKTCGKPSVGKCQHCDRGLCNDHTCHSANTPFSPLGGKASATYCPDCYLVVRLEAMQSW